MEQAIALSNIVDDQKATAKNRSPRPAMLIGLFLLMSIGPYPFFGLFSGLLNHFGMYEMASTLHRGVRSSLDGILFVWILLRVGSTSRSTYTVPLLLLLVHTAVENFRLLVLAWFYSQIMLWLTWDSVFSWIQVNASLYFLCKVFRLRLCKDGELPSVSSLSIQNIFFLMTVIAIFMAMDRLVSMYFVDSPYNSLTIKRGLFMFYPSVLALAWIGWIGLVAERNDRRSISLALLLLTLAVHVAIYFHFVFIEMPRLKETVDSSNVSFTFSAQPWLDLAFFRIGEAASILAMLQVVRWAGYEWSVCPRRIATVDEPINSLN